MTDHGCSRRVFLLGTATTFAGAVLAGCSAMKEPEAAENIPIQEVPVGGAVSVGQFFVAQPTEGVFKAYSSECTHQGGTVEVFENGKARCKEHNSQFSFDDGSVIWGPAREPLTSVPVQKWKKNVYIG